LHLQVLCNSNVEINHQCIDIFYYQGLQQSSFSIIIFNGQMNLNFFLANPNFRFSVKKKNSISKKKIVCKFYAVWDARLQKHINPSKKLLKLSRTLIFEFVTKAKNKKLRSWIKRGDAYKKHAIYFTLFFAKSKIKKKSRNLFKIKKTMWLSSNWV